MHLKLLDRIFVKGLLIDGKWLGSRSKMEVVMRITNHQVSIPADIKSLDKKVSGKNKSQASFQAKTKPGNLSSAAQSSLISRQELMTLAADFKNGLISKEEANKRFVAVVINNSLKHKLGEQDREKLMSDIQNFFSSDQDFVQKLTKNLKEFA